MKKRYLKICSLYTNLILEEVVNKVNNGDKPLAYIIFLKNKSKIEYVLNNTSSGGVTINDTVIHVSVNISSLGGVGNSGIGSYHGKASFDTFF